MAVESQFKVVGFERSNDWSNVTAHLEMENGERFRSQILGTMDEKNALFKYMKGSGDYGKTKAMVEHKGYNNMGFPVDPVLLYIFY